MSMCSSVSLMRLGLQIMPDVLKTPSEAQLEAGMHRYCLAKCARHGRAVACFFYQVKGGSSGSEAFITCVCLYNKNSLLSLSAGDVE